jgi:ketosteroid isomerase-like protein
MTRPAFSLSALLVLLASCATAPHQGGAMDDAPRQIRAALDSTAAGWNRGDLATYLGVYTDSASEMLSDGPAVGRHRIEQTMREGFWRTGRPLQQLRYQHVVVRMLAGNHALVTGQYVLSGADRPDRTGWFTTVWARTPAGWRMIHDHS